MTLPLEFFWIRPWRQQLHAVFQVIEVNIFRIDLKAAKGLQFACIITYLCRMQYTYIVN